MAHTADAREGGQVVVVHQKRGGVVTLVAGDENGEGRQRSRSAVGPGAGKRRVQKVRAHGSRRVGGKRRRRKREQIWIEPGWRSDRVRRSQRV